MGKRYIVRNFSFKLRILPNILTVIRIILVPLFIYVFLSKIKYHREIAGHIFVMSSITDFLDGYIARKYKSETEVGKLLDPIADKLLVISSLILLVIEGDISIWILGILFLRECILIFGSGLIIKKKYKIIKPSIMGKISTLTMFIGISLILYKISYGKTFLILGVILSVISGIDYMLKGIVILKYSNGCKDN